MDYPACVHVLNCFHHLHQEEPSGVFAHRPHRLTEVKQESTLHEFHHDEDQVVNNATRRLEYLPSVAVVDHSDDAHMIEVF